MGKAGQKPDQRPAMVHCYIFDGGQAESSKAGKITFGIDEKRIDLRLKPRNDMCNDWRGTERLQEICHRKRRLPASGSIVLRR